MNTEIIRVNNLSYSYATKEVLKKLSITINQLDTICIVGISGIGKTTLLKAICNLTGRKDKITGDIFIDEIVNTEFLKQSKGSIGYMSQTSTLMPNLTVEKNLKFPLKALELPFDNVHYSKILKMIGLGNDTAKYPHELSGGMQSRLALGCVYMSKPKILLLDEPFSSLDVGWKYELYSNFFDLKKEFGTTEIIVTHDIQEAVVLSNITYIFKLEGFLSEKYIIGKTPNIEEIDDLKLYLKSQNETYLTIQDEILKNKKSEL